jgi:matrixin
MQVQAVGPSLELMVLFKPSLRRHEIVVFSVMAAIAVMLLLPATGLVNVHGFVNLRLYKWYQTMPVKYCINSNVGTMKIGLTAAKGDILYVASEYQTASNSKLIFQETSYTDVNCKIKVHMGTLDPNYLANNVWTIKTPCDVFPCRLVSIDMTINSVYKDKIDRGPCVTPTQSTPPPGGYPGPYNMRYLMNHEIGHWVAMKHWNNNSPNSVMYPNYHCTKWSQLWYDDIETIKSMYPGTTSSSSNSLQAQSTGDGDGDGGGTEKVKISDKAGAGPIDKETAKKLRQQAQEEREAAREHAKEMREQQQQEQQQHDDELKIEEHILASGGSEIIEEQEEHHEDNNRTGGDRR